MCGQQDQSELTGSALQRLRDDLDLERLRESADLYVEVYREDLDLQTLTEAAIEGWPEWPVRIRFDGDRYFVDDGVIDLYGTGATLVEAQEDYWMAVQETHADLSANQDRLAPYLQDQLDFLTKAMATKPESAQ